MTFQFGVQLDAGKEGERELDDFFREQCGITIDTVGLKVDKRGIDRVFRWPSGKVATVEYKTDFKAAKTRNAFIETISVSSTNKPGWALTSEAQVLVYFIPEARDIHIFDMYLLKSMVEWTAAQGFRTGRASNNGYYTEGILVPLDWLLARTWLIESLKWELPDKGDANGMG